jgi:hypothetical protein
MSRRAAAGAAGHVFLCLGLADSLFGAVGAPRYVKTNKQEQSVFSGADQAELCMKPRQQLDEQIQKYLGFRA